MRIKEAAKLWMEYHKSHSKHSSIRAYKLVITKLCLEFGTESLEEITTENILSFLTEFHLFSRRMESPSPGSLPRIGVLKGKDLGYFMYFGLIFIILKRIYEESSPVIVLKQS